MDKTLSRPSFFFFKESVYKSGLYWLICSVANQVNIHGYVYLRAKEKWAEALGEKFLGLSCGLVPASKTQRNRDKTNWKGNLPASKKKN